MLAEVTVLCISKANFFTLKTPFFKGGYFFAFLYMPSTPEQQRGQDVAERREQWRAKTFRMMLSIVFIFGLPAAMAAVIGTRLDTVYASGRQWTWLLLVVAFILSWALTIRMYINLSREGREVDKAYRQYKEKQAKSLDELGQNNKK